VKAWKQAEARAAAIFGGSRFWANSGERVDFDGRIGNQRIHGQCKLVRTCSAEALTKLAEEKGVDVVCLKVRRGAGKPSPMLVIFTEAKYRALHGTGILNVDGAA
jgi:hypothetical protein